METSPPKQDTFSNIIIILLGLMWLAPISFFVQMMTWFITQLHGELGLSAKVVTFLWFSSSALQTILSLIPLLLLAILWPSAQARAVFQSWSWGAGFVLIMLLTRGWPETASQIVMIAQIGLSLIYLFILMAWLWLWYLKPHRSLKAVRFDMTSLGLALSLSALLAYPWLLYGALGSLLDVILSFIAALLFGLIASLSISQIYLRARDDDSNVMLDGFIASITLLIMASGFSTNGLQFFLMLLLPVIGWLTVIISHKNPHWLPLTFFIGLTIAMPLLFTDTDGVMLLNGLGSSGELLGWAWQATMIAIFLGSVLTLLSVIILNWQLPAWLTSGLGLTLWLIGGVIYVIIGQVGLYGDRLFVILKEQADVSAAASMTNYDERRNFVYETIINKADSSQADLRATLDQFGIVYQPYYLVNALEVRGGLVTRLWLMTRPEVERVLPSPILRPLPEPMPISSGSIMTAPTEIQWDLTNIQVDKVWQEFKVRGEGIVIGQSDSGVQGDHPEFAAAYRGANDTDDYNWFDPWFNTPKPTDIGGHGTHTLGSILGQHVGVAPEAKWIGCVNLARNVGNPALYLDCMQFMLAPFPQNGNPLKDGDPTKAAHVLNNSWGCPEVEGCDPTVLQPAVSALRAAGIFVVASAGNQGGIAGNVCSSVNDPIALYDEVFTVGAVDKDNNLAPFSSLGPVTADGSNRIKPDIVAPGVDILSAFPNNSYEKASGTSMAGPHVVGVVALIWSANPKLIGNIERTEQILTETAQPYTGPKAACGDTTVTPNNVAGYGIVDAYAAVKMALEK